MKTSFFFLLIALSATLFITAGYKMTGVSDNKGGVVEFTDANFQSKVLSSDKLTVVDFWAGWCGPCRKMGPVVEDLAKEYSGKVNIGKLNVDHSPNVCMKYGITSIPTMLFIKDGKVVDKTVGVYP
ncbi:MAG TPA: thioredoxin, partial [Niastella sp.]